MSTLGPQHILCKQSTRSLTKIPRESCIRSRSSTSGGRLTPFLPTPKARDVTGATRLSRQRPSTRLHSTLKTQSRSSYESWQTRHLCTMRLAEAERTASLSKARLWIEPSRRLSTVLRTLEGPDQSAGSGSIAQPVSRRRIRASRWWLLGLTSGCLSASWTILADGRRRVFRSTHL